MIGFKKPVKKPQKIKKTKAHSEKVREKKQAGCPFKTFNEGWDGSKFWRDWQPWAWW